MAKTLIIEPKVAASVSLIGREAITGRVVGWFQPRGEQ